MEVLNIKKVLLLLSQTLDLNVSNTESFQHTFTKKFGINNFICFEQTKKKVDTHDSFLPLGDHESSTKSI